MNTVEAKKGFKTFLILFSIFGLSLGIYKTVPRYLTSARAPEKPRNPQVKDPTSDSVSIAWETDVEVRGFVVYGTAPQELVRAAPEAQKAKSHQITIENLIPQTTYYYKIGSGEKVFDATASQFTTLEK